jgi:hypothetical protein
MVRLIRALCAACAVCQESSCSSARLYLAKLNGVVVLSADAVGRQLLNLLSLHPCQHKREDEHDLTTGCRYFGMCQQAHSTLSRLQCCVNKMNILKKRTNRQTCTGGGANTFLSDCSCAYIFMSRCKRCNITTAHTRQLGSDTWDRNNGIEKHA